MNKIDLINQQLGQIASDPKYNGYFIRAYEQRMFEKEQLFDNGIYIVVDFGAPTKNFDVAYTPVTLRVLSEANNIDTVLMLLDEYTTQFNYSTLTEGGYLKQFYNGEEVAENFAEIDTGLRALYFVQGVFIESPSLNPIVSIKYFDSAESTNGEEVKFLACADEYTVQINPVANYNALGNTRAEGATAVYMLILSCYADNSNLANKVIDQKFENVGINQPYYITVSYNNGKTLTKARFKLTDAKYNGEIASVPMNTYVFVRG